jgi:hypothetical protein
LFEIVNTGKSPIEIRQDYIFRESKAYNPPYMGWLVFYSFFGLVVIMVTVGVAPVLVNKTTDIHLDWIKPYLRECWTGLFIFFSLAYLLTPPTREVAMKVHAKYPEWIGYAICGLLGAAMFSAFWWFTGRVLTPEVAAKPPETLASGTISHPTETEIHAIIWSLIVEYKKSHGIKGDPVELPANAEAWINKALRQQERGFQVTFPKVAAKHTPTVSITGTNSVNFIGGRITGGVDISGGNKINFDGTDIRDKKH